MKRGGQGFSRRGSGQNALRAVGESSGIGSPIATPGLGEVLRRNTDGENAPPVKSLAGKKLVAVIDAGKCIVCGQCEDFCPLGAITVSSMVNIDTDKCIECGRCVAECPYGAITIIRA